MQIYGAGQPYTYPLKELPDRRVLFKAFYGRILESYWPLPVSSIGGGIILPVS